MSDTQSTRRRFLGTAGAAVVAGLAGCSSDGSTTDATGTSTATGTASSTGTATETGTATDAPEGRMRGPREGEQLPPDPNPDNGYPPEFDVVPEERSLQPSSYETLSRETQSGETVQVPLIPIEDAYYMYARRRARFVDARNETGYEVSHIFGAVLSPAPNGGERSDPVADWGKQEPVVTYCHCPHHLSTMRAAALIENGFQNVYAIDEGFQAWLDRNYPLAGSDTNRDYTVRTVRGRTDAADAGETAWAIHAPTDQVEATEIAEDGSYEMELKFVQVDRNSTITVETPSYTVDAPLGTLTNTTVTADTGAGNATAGNATASNTTFGNGTDAGGNRTVTNATFGGSNATDGGNGTATGTGDSSSLRFW
jgi:rhodanese-related sulfurtransferase